MSRQEIQLVADERFNSVRGHQISTKASSLS